jgi:hypothetical protein
MALSLAEVRELGGFPSMFVLGDVFGTIKMDGRYPAG